MPVLFIKMKFFFYFFSFLFSHLPEIFLVGSAVFIDFLSFVFLLACFPSQASGHYDVGLPFQAPTSLATGREPTMASVAYSMSDGRFTRTDSNASPVPSTLAQQVIF